MPLWSVAGVLATLLPALRAIELFCITVSATTFLVHRAVGAWIVSPLEGHVNETRNAATTPSATSLRRGRLTESVARNVLWVPNATTTTSACPTTAKSGG